MADYEIVTLKTALISAIEYAMKAGAEIPQDWLKTVAFYERKIEQLTRDLYNGRIEQREFEDALVSLMDQQLSKAWNEGMRENGLDPNKDFDDNQARILDDIKVKETEHIEDLSAAIVEAAQKDSEAGTPGGSLQGLYARDALWVNRYEDVVNTAIVVTSQPDDLLEWVYGDTDHCVTCETLNGQVATVAEWDESGYYPQSPPNDMLECGGWRCQCRLTPTKKPRTGPPTV